MNRTNGMLVDQEPFLVSEKSKLPLDVTLLAVKYYKTVGRLLDSDNMAWATLNNFEVEYSALVEIKTDTKAPVPKLDKGMTVVKWLESFKIHLMSIIGKRGIPLYYVERPESAFEPVPPALLTDQAYSDEHGSVESEMIARASHNHALYSLDNRDVFDRMERATRGNSTFAGTLTAHRRRKDERSAFMAYEGQHAGRDFWEAMITRSEFFMKNTKWNGNTSIKFITHSSKHHQSYIDD